MEDVLTTGRRHVRFSKLYVHALVKRAPNIFVALAWSQVRGDSWLLTPRLRALSDRCRLQGGGYVAAVSLWRGECQLTARAMVITHRAAHP